MRITFVSPPFQLGGGPHVMALYAERLRRRGHDVLVVAPAPQRASWRDVGRSLLRGQGWPVLKRQSHLDRTSVPRRVLERYRPVTDTDVPDADVVVATWWETAEWVAALAPRKGAKAHFIQGNEPEFAPPADRVARTWRLPMQRITCARWLADLIRERYGDPHALAVPNAVDFEQFSAEPRGKQPRPTVGILYSTAHVKGCDIALAAFERARRRVPGLRLRALSAHPPSRDLPLPPHTQYFQSPPQQAIRDVYAGCDVWLCGSRSEGFHLPPLEAMACRCPVVSTRVGGPLDIVEEGENGYLVEIGDVEALADRLVNIVNLPEASWARLSEAARATATRYSWDDATDLFERALETTVARAASGEILGGRPGSGRTGVAP